MAQLHQQLHKILSSKAHVKHCFKRHVILFYFFNNSARRQLILTKYDTYILSKHAANV